MIAPLLSPLEEAAAGAALLWRLPRFLRRPISAIEARASLKRRLEQREADFLALVERGIFANPANPYRALLRMVGCAAGDLQRLVHHEGIEGALLVLCRSGVYLTVEELKGRQAVVRGSTELRVAPSQLRNPRSARHLRTRSSGSRGAEVVASVDLAFVRERATNLALTFAVRGGRDWSYALWGVPGGAYVARMLEYSAFGQPPQRWFSQVDPAATGLHPRYRWSGSALGWGSRLAGVPLPRPEYVPLDDPLPVARWMAAELQAGRTPHLQTFVSPAVRLCEAARRAGLDLRGARLTVTGEPITARRLAAIRQSGVLAEPRYGTTECTLIGYGCMAPTEPDEVHVFQDLYALVQPDAQLSAGVLPARTLLVSTLRPTAPLVVLNLSLGDQATLVRRVCGCPMEQLGWTSHLHTIRSFEKLTAGGMSFLDADVIRVLDEVLPARFGGGPTDYQLVETETTEGHPLVQLRVHPALGPLNLAMVAEVFLQALGENGGPERVMVEQWRQAGLPRVEHQEPIPTATGKILHLHQASAQERADLAASGPRR